MKVLKHKNKVTENSSFIIFAGKHLKQNLMKKGVTRLLSRHSLPFEYTPYDWPLDNNVASTQAKE